MWSLHERHLRRVLARNGFTRKDGIFRSRRESDATFRWGSTLTIIVVIMLGIIIIKYRALIKWNDVESDESMGTTLNVADVKRRWRLEGARACVRGKSVRHDDFPDSMSKESMHPLRLDTHYTELLVATKPFRGHTPHEHGGYGGPWIENLWIDRYIGKPLGTFGPFVPLFIQWVDIAKSVSYDDVARVLEKTLRKDLLYVTVSQADFGLVFNDVDIMKRFPNILVLSSGGYGHVPIPLLKGEVRRDRTCAKVWPDKLPHDPGADLCLDAHSRTARVSFVGRPHFGRHAVLDAVEKSFASSSSSSGVNPRLIRHRGPSWDRVVASSPFCLVPRGFGRTSFLMYEAIQLSVVPIYVWDDREWLPYRDLDWDEMAISIQSSRLNTLTQRVRDVDSAAMRDRLMRRRDTHFTFDGVFDQIERFLIGGEELSDLRCEETIPDTPGLKKFSAVADLFYSVDVDADGFVTMSEMSTMLSSIVLTDANGQKARTTIAKDDLSRTLIDMDDDADDRISPREWVRHESVLMGLLNRGLAFSS